MNNELTAALATIEKCREITNCPDGVDLQDHLRQLAAENVGLKAAAILLADEAAHIYRRWNLIQQPDGDIVDMQTIHELLCACHELPATDRIYAGIKADALPDNIAEIIDSGDLETICYESERSYAEDFRLALYNFRQLREGVK